MATKFKLKYIDNPKAEFVWESLDISKARAEDLNYRMALIIHDITRPVRKHQESPGSDQLVKLFLALAENTQELAFVAYCAGTKVADIWDTSENDDEFDDYWEDEM